ncbi:MAG: hypothetical protein R2713_11290 [Ilumatobacteraceae bacterium]
MGATTSAARHRPPARCAREERINRLGFSYGSELSGVGDAVPRR